ncbi:MAG: pyridoxal phosphate-dependent aminotransferase, partial [Aeriscardovia sp.]|nr:pyridoxal phosphate-dependent aminotransferase [Aeriscardovia sp.]
MIIYSKRSDSGRLNDISIEEQKAGKISQLNDSNPTHFGLGIKKFGTYNPDPKGELPTRVALAEFLSKRKDRVSSLFLPHSPERLYLLSSTSQGYSWLIKLLCDPGEKVAYPSPGYPLIPSIASMEGVEAVPYFLRFDGSWYIDLPYLEKVLEDKSVKALVLIHPNNPTGSYVEKEEFEEVERMCKENGIAIICDEVFYEYSFSRTPGRISGFSSVLTFALDGFSKLLASPQIKTAWIEVSGPEEEVKEALTRLDFIADNFLPNSWFQNQSTPSLLKLAPEKVKEVRERCMENLELLKGAFSKPGLASSLIAPDGGWSALIRFPATVDEDELVKALIRQFSLSAQPGYFF